MTSKLQEKHTALKKENIEVVKKWNVLTFFYGYGLSNTDLDMNTDPNPQHWNTQGFFVEKR